MRSPRRRHAPSLRATVLTSVAFCCVALSMPAQQPLPARLSDAEFWKLVTDMSEPGGSFSSDNFTSNEMTFPRIISMLRTANDTGGVYLGVGPEQNLSYITGIRPRMAFVVDIRRQAVMQHLMYKAVFELSKDRVDFISLLFSKPRPAGLDTSSTIAQIWEAYWYLATDTLVYPRNLARITDHLTKTHGFALDSNDVASLRYVYEAFYRLGPAISYGGYGVSRSVMVTNIGTATLSTAYSTWITGTLSGTVAGTTVMRGPLTSVSTITSYYGGVNFGSLTASTDDADVARSFLANEDNYRFMKDLESKNLVIPVVGDFAGPKAIRGVGKYVRDHGSTITAFYTSNVEQYLFQNNVWGAFYENVATLPVTPASVFIRSGSSICPIPAFLSAFLAGRVRIYGDATRCAA